MGDDVSSDVVETGSAAGAGTADAGAAATGGAENSAAQAGTGTGAGAETGGTAQVTGNENTGAAQAGTETGAGAEQLGDDAVIGELQKLRSMLAGGDDKFLKQLERYKTPESLARGLREAYQSAKDAGKNKAPQRLSDKATPEEIKAFREAVGIPDDPAEYPVSFRDEFQASDADKAILSDFKAFAAENNLDPKASGAMLQWYEDFAVANRQRLDAQLAQTAKATQNALAAEWGGEYQGNIAGIQELLKTHLGNDGAEQFYNLRLADGSRVQDNVGLVKMLASIASDYYGANAIIVGDVEAAGQTTQQQLDDLLQLRVTDPDKYHSAEVQAKVQALFQRKAKLEQQRR